MKFIQDLADDTYKNRIKNSLLGKGFQWFYENSITKNYIDNRQVIPEGVELPEGLIRNPSKFVHVLFSENLVNSESIDFIIKITKSLEEKEGIIISTLISATCNLLTKDVSLPENSYNLPRVESSKSLQENIYTLLYYVNDSDGDTFLFNETYGSDRNNLTINITQTPQEGCGLLFEGNLYYADSSPRISENRAVITIVFETDEAISW